MKYILGLDVSTSTVGIALFTSDGNLLELNHISPIVKDETLNKHELLWEKAMLSVNFICENYLPETISEIIIETPLVSSKQLDTAALLNYYGGIFFATLKQKYVDTKFEYISVDDARRYGLPETVGGKGKTLFGIFKDTLDKKVVIEYKKMIVLSLVAQRYPSIIWLLNNNLMVDKKNLDRADAIVVALGHKQQTKQWTPKPQSIDRTVDFIGANILYEGFCKSLVGKKEEKDKKKYEYLKNIFQIEKYLNVAI